MNLIPKICEMLGVEIGEEFNLINTETKTLNITERTPTKYRLNNDCPTIIEYYIPAGDRWSRIDELYRILNGKLEIIKLPFEPKKGEKCFIISVVDKSVMPFIWDGTTTDYCFKACGNCFRSEAEAEKHKFEIYEKLTGRKWEEK